MKFDGDEEYKDPDDADFVPLDEEDDEFLEDDLGLGDDLLATDDDIDEDEDDEAELDVI